MKDSVTGGANPAFVVGVPASIITCFPCKNPGFAGLSEDSCTASYGGPMSYFFLP
jgi:hypothetical protein